MATAFAAMSCTALWGVDDLRFEPGAAGRAGSTGGSGGVGAAGGGASGGAEPEVATVGFALQLGGPGQQIGRDAALLDGGDFVVVADFDGALSDLEACVDSDGPESLPSAGGKDILVTRFAPDGNCRWRKTFGTAEGQVPLSVAASADRIAIVGGGSGALDFGGGSLALEQDQFDVFVVLLGLDGSFVSQTSFGGDGWQFASQVAFGPDGGLVIAGELQDSLTVGATLLESRGATDSFVASLAADLTPLWAVSWGSPEAEVTGGLAVDSAGSIAVSGSVAGQPDLPLTDLQWNGLEDAFVGRLDSAGQWQWGRLFGDALAQQAFELHVDGEGVLRVAGVMQGTVDLGSAGSLESAGGEDVMLLELDLASGVSLCGISAGGPGRQVARALAVDDGGFAVVGGAFEGELRLAGGGPGIVSTSADDIFFAAVAPGCEPLRSIGFPGSGGPQIPFAATAVGPRTLVATGAFIGQLNLGSTLLESVGGPDGEVAADDAFVVQLSGWQPGP